MNYDAVSLALRPPFPASPSCPAPFNPKDPYSPESAQKRIDAGRQAWQQIPKEVHNTVNGIESGRVTQRINGNGSVTGADGVERRAVEPGHIHQLATRFGINRPGPVPATVGAFPWGRLCREWDRPQEALWKTHNPRGTSSCRQR